MIDKELSNRMVPAADGKPKNKTIKTRSGGSITVNESDKPPVKPKPKPKPATNEDE